MLVFVVTDPKGEFVYVFDNHDAALSCRRDLKLTHWQLRGCSVSQDWKNRAPVRTPGDSVPSSE